MQSKWPRSGFAALVAVLSVAAVVTAAPSRFPGVDGSGLRANTPNDPNFDCSEPDDEDGRTCPGDLFAASPNQWGFAPDSTKTSAIYKDAARVGQGQISGVSADSAWKISTGRFDATVAVTDTGIRWNNSGVRKRVRLNERELPRPQDAAGTTLSNPSDQVFNGYDVNGDGAFNVEDYANDPRVNKSAGPDGFTNVIDGQDLLRTFSDGTDADNNGFIDDIAGWDFFEDDNDPSDTSSYSAASGHGTGRMNDAAEEGDDGQGGIGMCPRCSVMPLRVWDTFVSPGDNWAEAMTYAADRGVAATVAALGMLQNTRATKAANAYAASKGVALLQVSSDLNTADHNYPTNYNDSIYINGCVADAHGLSSEIFQGPAGLGSAGVPPQTWFRTSGLTQYGAKATVCFVGVTGSIDTGQAGGAAALLHSRGHEVALSTGGRLSSNEIKQLLTMTAEDVLPENTVGIGPADAAQVGFDEHFGYGRAHLGNAIRRIAPGKIPPEALIVSPPWWHLLDPEITAANNDTIPVTGYARARRSSACSYKLEYALGIEPTSYTQFSTGTCPSGDDATLGALPIDAIANLIPGSRTGSFTQSAAQRANPNQHTFTVRLTVTDAEGNKGEDRKVYFAHHDPTWTTGWPQFVDVGGETSPLLYDIDGNGTLEILDATSGGELCVYEHSGAKLASFNGGQCFLLGAAAFAHVNAPGHLSGAVPLPTSGFRTPAVADLDNDFEPDIVLPASDGRLLVLRPNGSVRLSLAIDPANSASNKRNNVDHPKRGLLGSATLADLDKDGVKEIILPALDGFVYVWNGATGIARPGFPKELKETPKPANLRARGELIQTVSVADLDADGFLEIVTGSSDVIPAAPKPPSGPPPLPTAGSGAYADYILANSAGGDSRVYALKADGSFVPGWPKAITGLLPDVLPFVGPQHGTAAADFDQDGKDDIVASITTGSVTMFKGSGGAPVAFGSQGVVNGGATSESSKVLNLFENTAIGNLNGIGQLDVAHMGVTVGQVANLLVVGQNAPFNWAMQAWDAQTPENYIAGFPTATDDYGLLTAPGISNVDGTGNAELVTGTGLYLLHAYTSAGQQAPKFPKLTGGWQFAAPAIGDVDGDGKLNLVMYTREGWRFVWNLDAATTTANNSEWWTEGHDECHSNNYRFDCRPPNRVKNLAYVAASGTVSFVAPGDDWAAGMPTKYLVRTSATPFLTAADWNAGTPLVDVTATVASGGSQTFNFAEPSTGLYLAVVPVDDQGNKAKWQQILVGDFAPVAQISVSPNPQAKGQNLVLDARASSDADGDAISEYRFVVTNAAGAVLADVRQASPTLTVSYPQSGNYSVALTVTAGGKSSATVNAGFALTNAAPIAQITATPDTGRTPLDVTLSASGSTDSDVGDAVVFYQYDFGDGSPVVNTMANSVSHTYTRADSYTAKVTVYDRENLASSTPANVTIVVLNQRPVASLAVTPNPQGKRKTLTLDGSRSASPDGVALVEYRFAAGDGSPEQVQSGATLSYTYLAKGSYTATLTVKDARDNVSANTSTVVVEITNTAPIAQLSADREQITAPDDVHFDASGSSDPDVGDGPRLYRFDFGDNTQVESVMPAVSHRYTAPGTYTATVTVVDEDNASSSPASVPIAVAAVQVEPPAVVNPIVAAGPAPTAPNTVQSSKGRFGGGALSLSTLLPLLLLAGLRRRCCR